MGDSLGARRLDIAETETEKFKSHNESLSKFRYT